MHTPKQGNPGVAKTHAECLQTPEKAAVGKGSKETMGHLQTPVSWRSSRSSSSFTKSPVCRVLILCKTRLCCFVVSELLKSLGIKVGFVVAGLGKETQRTMRKFRKGALDVVVSTAVLREGLDVPSCGLVVEMDAVKTLLDFIQARSKGV